MPSMLSREDVARYDEDGYIFVRGLFDAEETDLLRRAMEEDPAIRDHSLLRADLEGGATESHSGIARVIASMASPPARRVWWTRPRR